MMDEKIKDLIGQNPEVDRELLEEALREQEQLTGVVRTDMLTFSFNLPYSSLPSQTQHRVRQFETDQ